MARLTSISCILWGKYDSVLSLLDYLDRDQGYYIGYKNGSQFKFTFSDSRLKQIRGNFKNGSKVTCNNIIFH